MKLNAYTLYDIKSETFSPPFFAVSHGVATRMVIDLAGDLNTTVGRFPADYSLVCVGSFDDQLGLFLPLDKRQHVAEVATLAPKPQPLPLFPTGANGPNGSTQ